MKYLFTVILHKNENAYKLFSALRKNGINGTVLPAQSLKSTLLDSSVEPEPFFGGLRQVVEYGHDSNYTVFCVVDETELEKIKGIVREVSEEIKHKVGLMFAVPLTFVEDNI